MKKYIVFALLLIISSLCFSQSDNIIPREYIKIGIVPPIIHGAQFSPYYDSMVDGSAVAIGSLQVEVSSKNLTYKEIFDAVSREILDIHNSYIRFYRIDSVHYEVEIPDSPVTETKDFFINIRLIAAKGNTFELFRFIDGDYRTLYERIYDVPVNITVVKK